MTIDAELLKEIREWIVQFGFNQWQIFAIFFVICVFLRLGVILNYWNQRKALILEHLRQSKKLDSKIENERLRRQRKGEK